MKPIADETAEQSVLGAALLNRVALDETADIVEPTDFYWPKHEIIYAAALTVAQTETPVDVLTVTDQLRGDGNLDRAGGALYLHDLLDATPTTSNAPYYARIVRDKAILRRLADAASKIGQLAHSGGTPDELVETARAEIDATSRDTAQIRSVADVLDPLLEAIDRGEAAQIVAPTPWQDLTEHTGGFRRGAVYVIGARPGVGKSIAAIQIALELARTGFVSFHSLEMGENEITARFIAHQARVALGRLNGTGEKPNPKDWEKIAAVRGPMGELAARIQIDDRSTVTPLDIRSYARGAIRAAERAGQTLNGIIVDYLQLMSTPRGVHPSTPRHEIVGAFSRSLKILARELDVPVILLSQLNRSSVGSDRPPTMADLRESGAIEQDADVILLLHHANPGTADIDMLLEKNRHGMAPIGIELSRRGEFSALETRQWQPSYAGGA